MREQCSMCCGPLLTGLCGGVESFPERAPLSSVSICPGTLGTAGPWGLARVRGAGLEVEGGADPGGAAALTAHLVTPSDCSARKYR